MINITNLSVRYKETLAIDNINLQIDKPSIIGIIGPNGAGKSTLIKAILNIIPFEGTAEVDNKISKNALNNIAYVEQKINIRSLPSMVEKEQYFSWPESATVTFNRIKGKSLSNSTESHF